MLLQALFSKFQPVRLWRKTFNIRSGLLAEVSFEGGSRWTLLHLAEACPAFSGISHPLHSISSPASLILLRYFVQQSRFLLFLFWFVTASLQCFNLVSLSFHSILPAETIVQAGPLLRFIPLKVLFAKQLFWWQKKYFDRKQKSLLVPHFAVARLCSPVLHCRIKFLQTCLTIRLSRIQPSFHPFKPFNTYNKISNF